MGNWGISPNASEKEKLKSEFSDNIHGLNSVGEISYSTYSELFDFGMELLDRMYELGKEQAVDDDKTIKLPVPLGSVVYTFCTTCKHICVSQNRLFDKNLPGVFPNEKRTQDLSNFIHTCKQDICQVSLTNIKPVVLSFDNLEMVLKDWNVKYFKTDEEAIIKGKEFTDENLKNLEKLGFIV